MSAESNARSVTREELHSLVWAEPMQRLAKRFGISDVALAKRCRKLNVPVPGRGYWARKAAGQSVRVRALPKTPPGVPDKINFPDRPAAEPVEPPQEGPAWDQEQFESRPENRIVVPDVVTQLRRVVRATRAGLRPRGRRIARDAVVHAAGDRALDVSVSPTQADRAIRILETLLTAADVRGFALIPPATGQRTSALLVHGQTVLFRLVERERREDNPPPPPSPLTRFGLPTLTFHDRYRYVPTGTLELRVGDPAGYSPRSVFRDGKRQRVEDLLNAVIVGFVSIAVRQREIADAHAKREREWKQEQQRREEARLRHELAERQLHRFAEDASAWREAVRVRDFADAVEREARTRAGDASLAPDIASYLAWARAVADDRDPLRAQDLTGHLLREPLSLWRYQAAIRNARG